MAGRDKKGLTPADTDLWGRVSATIRPISPAKTKRVVSQRRTLKAGFSITKNQSQLPDVKEPLPSKPSTGPLKGNEFQNTPFPNPASAVSKRARDVTLAALDQKEVRRVRRGHIEIDATLDLHGMTLVNAYHRLCQFTAEAQRRQYRWLLVITGKGTAGRGVIRENFPSWLNDAPLNQMVVGYHVAQPAHGGGGAFYVRLRRPA